jgi:hypothetical protein
MLLSLAYQLAMWSNAYYQKIQGINLEEKILENTSDLFRILFITPFEGLHAPEYDRVIVIDEVSEGTKSEIAEFIRDSPGSQVRHGETKERGDVCPAR